MTMAAKQIKSGKPASNNDLPTKPDQREIDAMLRAYSRIRDSHPRISAKISKSKDGRIAEVVGPDHNDTRGWLIRLCNTFGTNQDDVALSELNKLIHALRPNVGDVSDGSLNAALAAVDGAHPQNEIEAMLVSEMAITHALAMELIGRAKRAEYLPQFESAGNMAVKLMRTYTAQVEALTKLQRGGEQTVRVEHVHVHSGGQAVVGNVNHQQCPGGGGGQENAGQPYAAEDPGAIAFAPGAPMRSADPKRDAVPITGSERQEPVPNARRREG
jgi:hypothetical protein